MKFINRGFKTEWAEFSVQFQLIDYKAGHEKNIHVSKLQFDGFLTRL
jgi:hypothetical protein